MIYINSIADMIEFIRACDKYELDCASSINFRMPNYEISPKEFLEFADIDLRDTTVKGKVGAVSNLKRALDCQLDMFFKAVNIKSIFDSKNLKFSKKIQFLSDIGMLLTNAMNKLNTIRNRMEHNYLVPTIEDLEVYYEMVWNVIEIINLNVHIMKMGEIRYVASVGQEKFYVENGYDISQRSFWFKITQRKTRDTNSIIKSLYKQDDYTEYVRAFQVFRCNIDFYDSDNAKEYKKRLKEISLIDI